MADLDAELLALAGDDSSGEESVASPPARRSPSPAPVVKTESRAKGVATKVKKSRKRRKYSDGEDDA
jgi:hypothetical protein